MDEPRAETVLLLVYNAIPTDDPPMENNFDACRTYLNNVDDSFVLRARVENAISCDCWMNGVSKLISFMDDSRERG